MADLTPRQAADRFRRFASGGLAVAVRKAAAEAAPIVAGTSIGQFMQNSGGGRRRADDRGPLRIVTGTLARAVRAPHGRDGSIREVTAEGSGSSLSITLTMGVSLAVVPYARVHEMGFSGSRLRDRAEVNIPARPYLRPAAEASRSAIATRTANIIRRAFRAEVAGL